MFHVRANKASKCLTGSSICDSWAVQEVASLNQPALHCLRWVQVVEAEGDGAVTAAEDAAAANDSPASPPKKKARAPRKKKEKEQAAPAKVHCDCLRDSLLVHDGLLTPVPVTPVPVTQDRTVVPKKQHEICTVSLQLLALDPPFSSSLSCCPQALCPIPLPAP